MKDKLMFFIRLLVGLGILLVLFKLVPYQDLKQQLQTANVKYIFLAFVQFFLLYFLGSWRWYLILHCFGVKLRYIETFYLLICGLFFNLFCPSIIASDVFRASMISIKHEQHDVTRTASTVILDRVSGFVGLFAVALVAVLFAPEVAKEPVVIVALGMLFIVLVSVCLFIFSHRVANFFIFFVSFIPKLKKVFLKLSEELRFFKQHPSVFLRAVIISMFIHSGVVVTFYICSRAFGVDVSFLNFCVIVPIVLVISVMPVSIAGLGTREIGSVYLMAKVGIAESSALGISLMNFVFMLSCGLIGGVLYVAFSHRWLQRDEKDRLSANAGL